jgi:hypothetical protein
MEIIKSIQVKPDDITEQLSQSFDYKFDGTSTFKLENLPVFPNEFSIGLIVGAKTKPSCYFQYLPVYDFVL